MFDEQKVQSMYDAVSEKLWSLKQLNVLNWQLSTIGITVHKTSP